MGTIELKLDAKAAPATVENFLQYVRDGHFDNTVFHRVISGFMIQGGGFAPGMQQKKTRDPIDNEANNGLRNEKYTVAMARTNDPNSASAQFFINVADNEFLNFKSATVEGYGYCVFGKVASGFEIVDKIAGVRTGTKGFHRDVPMIDVVLVKATEIPD
jgi:peptidyl-prolyl cis-trans isomerase B (cyclophilin B)